MPTDPDPSDPVTAFPAGDVAAAARVLADGGIVAYPTETVWGLAAHPDSSVGLARLVEVKLRDPRKPLQVSCVDAAAALTLALDDPALRLLAGWWPGPLTIVAPASEHCAPAFAPGGNVGLRVPDHPVARALLRAVGGQLVTTSCNVSGHAPATTYTQAVATGLADTVLPDGGVPASGRASTVVRVPGGAVIREGAVGAEVIRTALAAAGLTP